MNQIICAVCLQPVVKITTNERVCQGCLADARLGRMVRFNAKRFGITKKVTNTIEAALQDAGFDTPEEALEKAGVKG